ncbi:hypothetical protein ES705_20216 [subsurface metagenome]
MLFQERLIQLIIETLRGNLKTLIDLITIINLKND